MNGGKKNEALDEAYKESMLKPYGYLFIDLTQTQNNNFRIRNNIFPEDCDIFVNDSNKKVVKFKVLDSTDYNRLLRPTFTPITDPEVVKLETEKQITLEDVDKPEDEQSDIFKQPGTFE